MFAFIGVAGLWTMQRWGHRQQLQQQKRSRCSVDGAAHAAGGTGSGRHGRISPVGDRSSPNCKGRRPLSLQQHGRSSAALKDGSLVCFHDRTGQVAVVQPYGSGSSWQLAVTCASGGCCTLPHGVGSLSHVAADAVFLVRQVGGNYAFLSLGAEGRYLSAVRDISAPAMLDSGRLTPAAQWRVSPGHQGITNAHHTHKKLAFTIHELKAVGLESISSIERGISSLAAHQADKLSSAEGVNRSLQSQLLDAADQLAKARAEAEAQVAQLGNQLGEAAAYNSQLAALLEAKGAKLAGLKEHMSHIKHKHAAAERELGAAYKEVVSLQAQLADRDEDVANLQDRMCSETRQWGQLRAALQDSLAAKDEDIASLSLQLQRMESALRAVESMLYSCMRKPSRLDRASLDAVSITQLQAAVDNFAAVGEAAGGGSSCGLLLGPGDGGGATSPQEAEALRVLLQQQVGGGLGPNQLEGYTDLEVDPGQELPLQDLELDTLDQSPRKQPLEGMSMTAGNSSGSKQQAGNASATTAFTAAVYAAATSPRKHSSPQKGSQCAGGSSGVGGARGLLPHWSAAASDDAAVGTSRGARSSATSEGVHRYSGTCSDDDGDGAHGDEGADSRAGGEAGGTTHVAGDDDGGEDDDLVLSCHSMDEAEMQQHLGRLKASASQFSSSSSLRTMAAAAPAPGPAAAGAGRGRPHSQQQQEPHSPPRQQQQQLAAAGAPGPSLHASLQQLSRLRPATAAAAAAAVAAAAAGGRASVSLSPVKEEHVHQPPRSKSSAALVAGSSKSSGTSSSSRRMQS